MNKVFYILSLLIVFPAPFLFFLFLYNSIEKRAKKIIELLPNDFESKYTDVRIWFKGYDASKKINRYKIDPLKSLYSYNLANLYVYKEGLVVVGKMNAYGRIRLLSPFAICRPGATSHLSIVPNRVIYISAEVIGQDIDIKFQDQEYTNSIILVAKNIGIDLASKINTEV